MIPDHTNNGTLPPEHIAQREAGRQQRQSDARLIATPIPPLEKSLGDFKHYSLIGAVGLILLLIVALFTYVPRVGAAERPMPRAAVTMPDAKRPDPAKVTIVSVRSLDEGLYALEMASGDRYLVSPSTRATPAPKPGPARKGSNLVLFQGKHRYTIAAIIYYEDQP